MSSITFSSREISNQTEMATAATDFLTLISQQANKKGATIVGLSGELGAGKTTFTQAVAKTLGITETLTSPTFVIEKIYMISPTVKSSFTHLIHIDAYRLESPQELTKLGFNKIAADPKNLIFIEWPERISAILPIDTPILHFSHKNETTRHLFA